MPALEGGSALPITTGGTGQTEGGAAVPVYVVPGGPVIGQRARRVVVVTSGPVEGGGAVPVYDAGAGALYTDEAALPVFVVAGSLGAPSVVAPANSVLPAISGTLNLGQLLTTSDGTWSGSPTFTYQWKRGGVAIGGATNNTYTTVLADVGTTITSTVTATNAGGATDATSAGVVIFGPTTIAGLQAWLRADALALNNNDPVASWTDSSGLAHHAVQASGTLQPLYQTNQVNSLPALLFDGVDDFLQTGVFTLSHPCTAFVVVKQVTWTGSDRIHEGRSAGNTLLLRQNSATPSIQMVGTNSGTTVVGPAIGAWGLVTEVWNAASSAIAINGGADAAFDLGVAKTPNGLSLGSSHAGISNGNVSIAEFIVYDTALSAPSIALVKAYLNAKYTLF